MNDNARHSNVNPCSSKITILLKLVIDFYGKILARFIFPLNEQVENRVYINKPAASENLKTKTNLVKAKLTSKKLRKGQKNFSRINKLLLKVQVRLFG